MNKSLATAVAGSGGTLAHAPSWTTLTQEGAALLVGGGGGGLASSQERSVAESQPVCVPAIYPVKGKAGGDGRDGLAELQQA
jgi:hypothetical protein